MKGLTKLITSGSLKGQKINIEDTWKNVFGKSWMFSERNPTCLIYAMRSAKDNLPIDDNVWYGKIDGMSHLVHESEVDKEERC